MGNVKTIFNRTQNAEGVWNYNEQDEAEFVFFNAFHLSIDSVDDFIEGRQGLELSEDNVSALCGLRHDAFQAFKEKNVPLMESRCKTLEYACRICGMAGLAKKGSQFKSGRRKGTKGKFRLIVEEAAESSISKTWKSVIQSMESMDDIQEVDWGSEEIWVRGEEKARRFKTVINILSEH